MSPEPRAPSPEPRATSPEPRATSSEPQATSPGKTRAAIWLWILFAFVVWNVVFDRVIVDAGREYVYLARAAANANAAYVKIDDTMRPARSRAFWLASASATATLLVFISLTRLRKT